MDIFEEYLNDESVEKRERAKLWRTYIGLQAVDNLTVSNHLIEIARQHIEGEISINEACQLIEEYYRKKKDMIPNAHSSQKGLFEQPYIDE